jgi:hypothetical protein
MKRIVLVFALAVLWACSRDQERDVRKSDAKPRSMRPVAAVRVVPSSAAEITHEYQGLIQSSDGSTRWVVLNIRRADPRDGGFTIDYTINGPGHRLNATTTVDASGSLTIEKVASHFARGADGRLMIESSALAGPPFWQLVQTRGPQ